ncbi:uncharacterized GMC-type oxidoreductase Mb1310-like [Diabrotica virgifera virgifera]|uniref:Glucose dehydrogenase [FAD, quinone]-like n=1 Tax=Diabrotica virgifera virgifera TaxID=50390 RepID=A0ABM5JLC5_DIAVI|nr:uncharacterized GMC-type oxidoreductase Mb1310-like [Diabrotica virgifera virgifera]
MKIITIICVIIFGSFLIVYGQTSSKVKSYMDLMEEGSKSSMTYEFPTNAKMYEATEEPIIDYGTYDFVIIGGGTAGCVVANRLSEIENWSVLVIEAGNYTSLGVHEFLSNTFSLTQHSNFNWGFPMVSQKPDGSGNNETNRYPRGKGVGGSSLINPAICTKGNPENYNNWAEITNDLTWTYNNVLKYFKKAENFHWTDQYAPVNMKYHGTKGMMTIQHSVPHNFLTQTFLDANIDLKMNLTDYNSPSQLGGSVFQIFLKDGKREDTGSVYITPFLKRRNLRVLTNSFVTKIEINSLNKTASSVIFTNSGRTFRVKAKKEIILSAGVVGSPQILMLSGVGPHKHLREIGIDVIKNLEVGSSFVDHPLVMLGFKSNMTITEEPIQKKVADLCQGKGSLTSFTISQGVGFYRVNPYGNNKAPNVEVFPLVLKYSQSGPGLYESDTDIYQAYFADRDQQMGFYFSNIAPISRGTIRLKNKDPFEYPLINPKFFSDVNNTDIEVSYKGLELIFNMINTPSYQKLGFKYVANPLPPCESFTKSSREYWYCYIRYMAAPFYHGTGTCSMGKSHETGAVVDSKLKVFGINKLRVVDASIFPTPIAGHTEMPVLMVAEKISDEIKAYYL